MGLCLFLPRYTQLPAPAPSFVEATMGAVRVTPPAAAIAQATELVDRLIQEDRVIPLNLLGAVSEQPDFLTTPEVLPWVYAVRGDRQWKTAPPGRTTPIVLRTWEALDRDGEQSAIDLRENLGRELTEAAVLRALIELWTTLRAIPRYAAGQPVRWALLKNRYPAQLATGANTAQTTALSALLSIYLRTAVAATAEEAEIFLSPLTARSRIRDVIHGMMAARQFRTMSLGTKTMLFVEGSLPETVATEPEAQAIEPAAPAPLAPRMPFRKGPRPVKWEMPSRPRQQREQSGDRPRRDFGKPTAGPAGGRREAGPQRDWQPGARKPPARFAPEKGEHRGIPPSHGAADPRRPFADRRAPEGKPFAGNRPASGPRPPRDNAVRPGAKPWQRSGQPSSGRASRNDAFPKPDREARSDYPRPVGRSSSEGRPQRDNRPPGKKRWRDNAGAKPRFQGPKRDFGEKPRFSGPGGTGPRGNAPGKPAVENSGPGRPPAGRTVPGRTGFSKPGFKKPGFSKAGLSKPGFKKPGFKKPGFKKPGFSKAGFSKPGFNKPGFAKPGPGGARAARPASGGPRSAGPPRRFPSSQTGERPGRPPSRPGNRPGLNNKPLRKPFRGANSSPGERNPRKNRKQEENPE